MFYHIVFCISQCPVGVLRLMSFFLISSNQKANIINGKDGAKRFPMRIVLAPIASATGSTKMSTNKRPRLRRHAPGTAQLWLMKPIWKNEKSSVLRIRIAAHMAKNVDAAKYTVCA